MIVRVKYKIHDGEYSLSQYAYITSLPLKDGDLVIAPTYKGESIAMVSETNVVAETLPPTVLKVIKEITSYAPTEGEDD